MNSFIKFFKNDRNVLLTAVVVGLIFTACLGLASRTYAETAQNSIAHEVIRFHVLANSDSDEDQSLKLKVRDGVLEQFQYGLSQAQSKEESRSFLYAHLDEIKEYADHIVKENGFDYPVAISLTRDYFPTKAYGDVVFPPGEYDTLRIEIGKGSGQNWWCVMFPPLCYVDVTQGKMNEEGKQQLKHVLDESEYLLVTESSTNSDVQVKIKFKLVEWWQERKQPQTDQERLVYHEAEERQ